MPGEMPQMVTVRPNADAVRHQDRRGVIRNPRRRRFCSDRSSRHHSDRLSLPGLGYVRMVSPRSPDGRLLARLALPWLACPSCPQWEAASRPGPQCVCAASAGLRIAFSCAMLLRSASMRFTAFWGRARACSRDTGRPACFFLSISTTASS